MTVSRNGELLLPILATELLNDERVLASGERDLLRNLLDESRNQATGNAELDDAVSRRLVSAVVGSMGGRIVSALADELVRLLLSRHGGRGPDANMAPQVSPVGPGNSGAPQVSPSNPGNLTRVPPSLGPDKSPTPPGGNNMAPQVSPSNPGNTGGQVSPSNPGNYMAPQVSPVGPGNSGAPQVSPSNPGNLRGPEPTRRAEDAVHGAKPARKR